MCGIAFRKGLFYLRAQQMVDEFFSGFRIGAVGDQNGRIRDKQCSNTLFVWIHDAYGFFVLDSFISIIGIYDPYCAVTFANSTSYLAV